MTIEEYLRSLESYLKFADEEDVTLIKGTLDKLVQREVSMAKRKIEKYKAMGRKFEQKYEMSFEEFKKKFEKGEIEKDMDYLEWSSVVESKKHWEEKLKALQDVSKPAPSASGG